MHNRREDRNATSERLNPMEIRFISSLTAEDENLFAPAVLKAVSALLDQLPIAYSIRIETTGALALQHTHAGAPTHVRDEEPEQFEGAGAPPWPA